jgi:uncharacterized protein YdeI (YjbR/CyaY-like superfamily)
MDVGETLYIKDAAAWRAWLKKNFNKKEEIWLLFPHKASGRARISYNDAVEEALCFGWIDSIVKRVDAQTSAQRFSPRKPGSSWSQPNKERLRWLMKKGKLYPTVKKALTPVLKEKFIFPADIIKEIRGSKEAWREYQKFSPAYRRIRIAYIEGARKRPAEFKKRLKNFITMTEQGKHIGFGGIEKHY